jgi:hypothetical protein
MGAIPGAGRFPGLFRNHGTQDSRSSRGIENHGSLRREASLQVANVFQVKSEDTQPIVKTVVRDPAQRE